MKTPQELRAEQILKRLLFDIDKLFLSNVKISKIRKRNGSYYVKLMY
jgi:hypothetical protein